MKIGWDQWKWQQQYSSCLINLKFKFILLINQREINNGSAADHFILSIATKVRGRDAYPKDFLQLGDPDLCILNLEIIVVSVLPQIRQIYHLFYLLPHLIDIYHHLQ